MIITGMDDYLERTRRNLPDQTGGVSNAAVAAANGGTAPTPDVMTMDTSPKPTGMTPDASPTITMNTDPKPTGVTQNPPPQPWDDPNYQEPAPPDASVYAGQGGAMVTADQNRNAPTSTPPDRTTTYEQGSNLPSDPVPGDAGYKPPQDAPPPETPYSSTAGDNASAYVNKVSANLGKDPGQITAAGSSASDYITKKAASLGGDPGYDTEAGKLYADRVTNGLKTPDASSVNVQNTADTNAARRQYLSNVQAGEAQGQSGFAPGSAQAQRIASQAQAGVNSANQAGQSAANDYLRQRTQDNMNAAQGLEASQHLKTRENLSDANALEARQNAQNQTNLGEAQAQDTQGYNRDQTAKKAYIDAQKVKYDQGRDTVADSQWNTNHADARTDVATGNAHWDTLNKQQQDQLAIENKTVAGGTDDTKKRNLLAGLPEGPAKNVVMSGLADGSLTLQNALAKVMNPDGSIKPEYRGIDPATAAVQGSQKNAEAWVAATTALQPGTPEFDKAVKDRMISLDSATTKPLTDAQKLTADTDAAERMAKAGVNTPDPKDLETLIPIDPKTIPRGTETQSWLSSNKTGGWVSVAGEPLKVIGGDSIEDNKAFPGKATSGHTDFIIVQTKSGQKLWIDANGTQYTSDPNSGPADSWTKRKAG